MASNLQNMPPVRVAVKSLPFGTSQDQALFAAYFAMVRGKRGEDPSALDHFEPYDVLGYSLYVLAFHAERVISGVRFTPTDRHLGSGKVRYSYRLRDIALGLHPGWSIVSDTLTWPTDPSVYEVGDFVGEPSLWQSLLARGAEHLAECGVRELLVQATPEVEKSLRRVSPVVTAVGELLRDADVSKIFCTTIAEKDWPDKMPQDAFLA